MRRSIILMASLNVRSIDDALLNAWTRHSIAAVRRIAQMEVARRLALV